MWRGGRARAAADAVGQLQGSRPSRTPASAAFNNIANLYPPPMPPQQQKQQEQQQQQQQQQQWSEPSSPPEEREPVKSESMDTAEGEDASADSQTTAPGRPPWMKTKLSGVKKVSNRERRRRQNENLRRLITPKNALTVLNEMLPGEALTGQFRVEQEGAPQFFQKNNSKTFYADLTVDGRTYRGYGENKVAARNAAAEQAIRDLIIKRMTKYLSGGVASSVGGAGGTGGTGGTGEGATGESGEGGEGTDEQEDNEALPMIQLTSFALYKLFSEWESEGHKVPQLRQMPELVDRAADTVSAYKTNTSLVDQRHYVDHAFSGDLLDPNVAGATNVALPRPKTPKPPKKPREVPPNANIMHPCMLLTYMRQNLEYRELAIEGDKPQNMLFTMGIEVDGRLFVGKASNKKEARRLAAKAACETLFEVSFEAGGVPKT
ncbi:hypothetical protein EVAR_88745_1 [Eumeta japonica]|uniref:DRBM domain-containing protein n=1 Tax=Eumeta variegata TaxID=151549 RepID=A0A4C1XRB2_EUMVA|nr:hypothetical protein EVAR_88745_1 [Eumeta japonica]